MKKSKFKKVNPREIRTELTESGDNLSLRFWIVILTCVSLTFAAVAVLKYFHILTF